MKLPESPKKKTEQENVEKQVFHKLNPEVQNIRSSEICLLVNIKFFPIHVPQVSVHILLKAATSAFN